jgi:hypothetical protein
MMKLNRNSKLNNTLTFKYLTMSYYVKLSAMLLLPLLFFASCQTPNAEEQTEQLVTRIALSPEYADYRDAFSDLTRAILNADIQAMEDARNTGKYDDNEPLPDEILKNIQGALECEEKQRAWDDAYDKIDKAYAFGSLSPDEKKSVETAYYSLVTERPVILPPSLTNNKD